MPGHITEWSAQDIVDLLSDVLDEQEKSGILRHNINGLVLKDFGTLLFLVKVLGLSKRASFQLLLRLKDHLGVKFIYLDPDNVGDREIRVVAPVRVSFEDLGIHGAGDAAETAWRTRRRQLFLLRRSILGR
ncbi:hypothetical protein COOONC_28567 [Cooperia oncophora]